MLTVIVLCSIPVYAILSAVVTPLFKKRLDEKFETGANTQSFLVESITGVQTVKSYALEPKFEKKWGELQADYVKASYKTSMVSATAVRQVSSYRRYLTFSSFSLERRP